LVIVRYILGANLPTFVRHILGCDSSPTFVRSLFAYPSLIVRSSFAHRSLIVRSSFVHRSLIVRSSFVINSVNFPSVKEWKKKWDKRKICFL